MPIRHEKGLPLTNRGCGGIMYILDTGEFVALRLHFAPTPTLPLK